MERIYSGCPVVRKETVRFRMPHHDGSAIVEHRVLWLRQSTADVALRRMTGKREVTPSSSASDRRGLFESVDSAVLTAKGTAAGWEVYLDRINKGQFELVVSATVRDIPVLEDDRALRPWTSMDSLLPSYNRIPEGWTLGTAPRPRRAAPASRPALEPVVVLAAKTVWSSAAGHAENAAAMAELRQLDPSSVAGPEYEAEPERAMAMAG